MTEIDLENAQRGGQQVSGLETEKGSRRNKGGAEGEEREQYRDGETGSFTFGESKTKRETSKTAVWSKLVGN